MRRNKLPNPVGRPDSVCANCTVFSCASLRTALHLERRTARGNVRLLNGGFGEKKPPFGSLELDRRSGRRRLKVVVVYLVRFAQIAVLVLASGDAEVTHD